MAYYKKWKPSKTAKKEYAEKMDEISIYCDKNNISQSRSSDSYYFSINNISYRVSNHTIARSTYADIFGNVKYYHDNDNPDTVYITASKTRIIQIHTDLKKGIELDKRGNRKQKGGITQYGTYNFK